MSPAERHLHVVPMSRTAAEGASTERDDLGLTLILFLVAALPPTSAMAGLGRWDASSLGLGTLGVLLLGRELGSQLLARWRNRRRA